jgi:hypothetical protein
MVIDAQRRQLQNFSTQISKAHLATVPLEKLAQKKSGKEYPYTLAHERAF